MLHRALHLTTLFLGLAAAAGDLQITERDLRAYDGSDSEKPIYLAIRGTIFDVSASPAFYGPGGHYNHFTGKDATRAWVTECWDDKDQLTWRMDGLEAMFTPTWMDEEMERMGKGELTKGLQGVEGINVEQLAMIAGKATERFGSVPEKEKENRRAEDKKEADEKIKEVLDKWYTFFDGNPKYSVVGHVIKDEEGTPAPPEICQTAMDKRPVKGGKMESLMTGMGGNMGKMAGYEMGKGSEGERQEMPEHLKNGKAAKKVAEAKDEL